jgi:hypothetical protein
LVKLVLLVWLIYQVQRRMRAVIQRSVQEKSIIGSGGTAIVDWDVQGDLSRSRPSLHQGIKLLFYKFQTYIS